MVTNYSLPLKVNSSFLQGDLLTGRAKAYSSSGEQEGNRGVKPLPQRASIRLLVPLGGREEFPDCQGTLFATRCPAPYENL
jgi:hypothetical protein